MSFARYPKYKDSGVEWIGEVPADWDVVRLGNLFREVADPGNDELPILSVSIHSGVSDEEMSEEDMERKVTRSEDRSKYIRVAPGDLVYNMMRAWQGGFGTVGVAGMVSPAYVVARPRRLIDTAFVEYLLRTPQAIEQLRRHSHGVTDFRLRLYWGEFKDIRVALPSLAEQKMIVDFVAQTAERIDALVAEQQRLMELLKEKRQAVISHAVTKGLNPHAPMKDSGIEWFGEVPSHWNLGLKLKGLARNESASFTNGPFGSDLLTTELQDEGVPVVYIRDLRASGYCRTSTSHVTDQKAKQLDKFRVDSGDILIAKVGDPPGFACTYPIGEPPAIICQDVIRLKPNTQLVFAEYVCFLLNSRPGMEAIDSVCVELTRKRFSLADLQSLRLPMPPRPEQEDIVGGLKNSLDEIDSLSADAQRAVDLLAERRTSLISAAVTGQIDIRQLAKKQAAA